MFLSPVPRAITTRYMRRGATLRATGVVSEPTSTHISQGGWLSRSRLFPLRSSFKSQRPLFITSLTFPVCCLFDKTQRALLEFGIPSLQGPGLQKREKMVILWCL